MKWPITVALLFLSASVGWSSWLQWPEGLLPATPPYQVTGYVTAIAVDNQDKEVIVRVQTKSSTRTLRVCAKGLKHRGLDVRAQQKMKALKKAMAKGYRVHLSYTGRFDRCLSTVAAAAGKNKSHVVDI